MRIGAQTAVSDALHRVCERFADLVRALTRPDSTALDVRAAAQHYRYEVDHLTHLLRSFEEIDNMVASSGDAGEDEDELPF